MPTAILAVLLLAATVDPRLAEPLRLLAEVGARDVGGMSLAGFYAKVPDALGLTLTVRPLPDGMDGGYDRPQRRITIAKDVLSEVPRIVAVILAHALRHAADLEWLAQGAVNVACLEIESRSFEAEALVARAFWPDGLLTGTERERGLASMVEAYERGGLVGLRAGLERNAVYEDDCAAWES